MATKIPNIPNTQGELLETPDALKLQYFRNRFSPVCFYATWPAKDEQAAVEMVGRLAAQRGEKASLILTYPGVVEGQVGIRWVMK